MEKVNTTLESVEHNGDIDQIVSFMHENGCTNIHYRHDYDNEELHINFEVEDFQKLKKIAADDDSVSVFFDF